MTAQREYARRPKLSVITSDLPNPVSDNTAYLLECRRRIRRAIRDFDAAERQIEQLDKFYTEVLGDSSGKRINSDGQIATLTDTRENARQRVRTYAAAIQAEMSVAALRLGVHEPPKPRAAEREEVR